MFCEQCGAELNEGAKFCSSCGAKIGGASDSSSQRASYSSERRDGFRGTPRGLFGGIFTGINSMMQRAADTQAVKEDVIKFIPEYLAELSEDELRDVAYLTITTHKYFVQKMGFIGTDAISKAFGETITLSKFTRTMGEMNLQAPDDVLQIAAKITSDFDKIPGFEYFRTSVNASGVFIKNLEPSVYNEIFKRQQEKFGEHAKLKDVVDCFTDEELYEPYNAYYLSAFFINNAFRKYSIVLDKYEEATSAQFYSCRRLKQAEKIGLGELGTVDLIYREDGKQVLVNVLDGVFYEVEVFDGNIKTKDQSIKAQKEPIYTIPVKEIDFFKVEGEYHRDSITSGGGTDYLMTTAAGYSGIGGSYHSDIKTEIRVEDTRAVVMYTKSGKRKYNYNALGLFEKILPDKEIDIVKAGRMQAPTNKIDESNEAEKKGTHDDIMEKFEKLEKLKSAGLITPEEYERKRSALVDEL